MAEDWDEWEDTWQRRFEGWWIASPYKDGAQACMGALGLLLSSRWERFMHGMRGGALPPAENAQTTAECESLIEAAKSSLPQFPDAPDSLKFEIPKVMPIPRLLPKWRRLISIIPFQSRLAASAAHGGVPHADEANAGIPAAASAAIGGVVGFALTGVIIAGAAEIVKLRRARSGGDVAAKGRFSVRSVAEPRMSY